MASVHQASSFERPYPPHYNSHIIPDHSTLSELRADRLQNARNSANLLFENHLQKYPYRLPEQPAPKIQYIEKPT